MNCKRILEEWKKLIEKEDFVEEHLEAKNYIKALYRVKADIEGNCIMVNIHDFQNPKEYALILKDGKMDFRVGRAKLLKNPCPLDFERFNELSKKLFEELNLL